MSTPETERSSSPSSPPRTSSGVWWSNLRRSRHLQLTVDVTILCAALLLGYLLRFDFLLPREVGVPLLIQLPFVALVQVATLRFSGVYSFIWRYIGLSEVAAFVKAAAVSTLLL